MIWAPALAVLLEKPTFALSFLRSPMVIVVLGFATRF
jgi:hypothetical protein